MGSEQGKAKMLIKAPEAIERSRITSMSSEMTMLRNFGWIRFGFRAVGDLIAWN